VAQQARCQLLRPTPASGLMLYRWALFSTHAPLLTADLFACHAPLPCAAGMWHALCVMRHLSHVFICHVLRPAPGTLSWQPSMRMSQYLYLGPLTGVATSSAPPR
jgi:hypothetical protein